MTMQEDTRFSRSAKYRLLLPLVVGAALALSACSTTEEEYVERPVAELYNEAQDSLKKGEYEEAAKSFDEVERQHPYSIWASKAQVMAAYANYEALKYDDAIAALQRFLRLHPGNRDAAYAQYLLALCYYDQISDVVRDQKMTSSAREALTEVVTRYPNSKYAKDARVKLDLTDDHLAGKEMEIGRYYMRWRQYIAAINRFKQVIEEHQTTTHTPEALHRLVEAYTAMGMVAEAQKTASVLGHNFPGSEWYQDTYELMTKGRTRQEIGTFDFLIGRDEDSGKVRSLKAAEDEEKEEEEPKPQKPEPVEEKEEAGKELDKPWWNIFD